MRATQVFSRWARLGIWERLFTLVQKRDVQLGMMFLDRTNIRTHQKAAGLRERGSRGEWLGGARRAIAR